jgi:hypothetical protein
LIAIPFKPEHLASLRAQPEQMIEVSALTPEFAAGLARTDAWTIVDGEETLFCGGVVEYQGIGVLWAAVSSRIGRRMITVTRMCQRYLSLSSLRIETSVRTDFAPGCRWAELLGFRREQHLPREGFDGSDHYRYVKH